MAKPTLLTFENESFARGADVFVNDGAILAETQGNLEPIVNISSYNNVHVLHVAFRKSWYYTSVAVGAEWTPFVMIVPSQVSITDAHYIAYDGQNNNTTFTGRNGAAVANAITISVDILSSDASQKTIHDAVFSQELTDSNLDYALTSTTAEAGIDNTLKINATVKSGSHADFDPLVEATFVLKEIHV
jgi:hypothetical protein